MSDNYTDENDGDNDFKLLRKKADKADALERENAQIKRELAFTKAGIPLDDPKMGYFVKGYDGDLEPQAIKQAAIEAGFIQQQAAPPDPAVEQAQQGQQRVMAAAVGSEQAGTSQMIQHGMKQAQAQGGLAGLSAYTSQFGVTFEER